MPFSWHHIQGIYYQHDLPLVILSWSKPGLGNVCQLSPLERYSFLPIFKLCSLEGNSVCSLHLRKGDLGSISFEVEYLHTLFGILLNVRFVSSAIFSWSLLSFYIHIGSFLLSLFYFFKILRQEKYCTYIAT